jgi:hypothetical protein
MAAFVSEKKLQLAEQINKYMKNKKAPDKMSLLDRQHIFKQADGSVLVKFAPHIGHQSVRAAYLNIEYNGENHPEVYPSSKIGKTVDRAFTKKELGAFVSHQTELLLKLLIHLKITTSVLLLIISC